MFERLMIPQVLKVQNSTEELQRLFNILDTTGNSKINFENLKDIARQSGKQGSKGETISDEDLRDIIAEGDLDKDKCLNFLEFCK
jgi:Ca2+-binding EF-hand superfamily protein